MRKKGIMLHQYKVIKTKASYIYIYIYIYIYVKTTLYQWVCWKMHITIYVSGLDINSNQYNGVREKMTDNFPYMIH